MCSRTIPLVLGVILVACLIELSLASPTEDSTATTEFSCNFGMEKGEDKQSCSVPFPRGCVVANFPGTTKPWTTISKGGSTTCQFDDRATDWRTRITGTCSRCKTERCSAIFSVRFDCSQSK